VDGSIDPVIESDTDATTITGKGIIQRDDPGVGVEILRTNRTSASPADNDNVQISHFAENDNNLQKEYARDTITQLDVSDGTEKGRKTISVADGADGSLDPVLDVDIDGMDLLVGSHKMGGSEIIDSSRNADFVSLDIGSTAVIDSSRNATNLTSTTTVLDSTTAGITASTTQTQGQQALTSKLNEVSTVANTDDVVTLPSAAAGLKVTIINNGANRLQIFPASGDDLGNGVDSSGELGPGDNVTIEAFDTTTWIVKNGLIVRTINIGDWNMDTTTQVNITHNLTLANIMSIKAIIRNDTNVICYDITGEITVVGIDGYVQANSTDAILTRVVGGFFDATTFDLTPFNRGFIVMQYKI